MTSEVANAPAADWFTLADLWEDPYPIFARLREEAPVAWSEGFDRFFVSRYEDCAFIERNDGLFEPDQEPRSKMKRAIGPNMLSKGDPEHARERGVVNPSLRPRAVDEQWEPVFRANAERFLAEFERLGPGADLVEHLAVPYSATNLAAVVGLPGASVEEVNRWSQAFIASVGNHALLPEVFERSDRCNEEVDALIDEAVPYYRRSPDASMLSAMANSELPIELIRTNTKLAISGGVNEPQHTLVNGVWALDRHPEQRDAAIADPELFRAAFDETVRWLSPITSIGRRARVDTELQGVPIPEGSYLFALVGSANRDPRQFPDPDVYEIRRPRGAHLAFGAGIHMCAGSWVARSAIGAVMWPLLYSRLPGLRPVDPGAARWSGFTFRGIESLPATWGDAA